MKNRLKVFAAGVLVSLAAVLLIAQTPTGLLFATRIRFAAGPWISSGSASPEGSQASPVGSLYLRSSTALYWKATGTGNTGWTTIGGAPLDATYITQTANGTLTNEQALSSLSTGIMRVATTTGVITSLTDSAGIAANLSDETGSGALVFGTSPQISAIELGHPSDTTLARSAAGAVSIEGVDIVTLSGTQTLTNKTLTAPRFADGGSVNDTTGNPIITFDTIGALHANAWTITPGGTGSNPIIAATGGDADIGLDFQVKAAGVYRFLATASGASQLRLFEDSDNGTSYTAILAAASLAGNISFTLPPDDGDAGEQLQTDGSGNLTWEAAGGGSITVTDTHVLFGDGANNPAGDAGFTYNKTTDSATLAGSLIAKILNVNTTGTAQVLDLTTSLTAATGNEIAARILYTTNKAISGDDTGLLIAMTDTASPGTSRPLRITVGGTTIFYTDQTGQTILGNNLLRFDPSNQLIYAQASGAANFDISKTAYSTTSEVSLRLNADVNGPTLAGDVTTYRLLKVQNPVITASTTDRTITNGATMGIAGSPPVTGTAYITKGSALEVGRDGSSVQNKAATEWSAIYTPAQTMTLTKTTQVTSTIGAALLRLETLTVAQSGGAVTVDKAAALYIAAAPAAGASVTLTNSYAVYIAAGTFKSLAGVDAATFHVSGTAGSDCASAGVVTSTKGIVTACSEPTRADYVRIWQSHVQTDLDVLRAEIAALRHELTTLRKGL